MSLNLFPEDMDLFVAVEYDLYLVDSEWTFEG